VPAAALREAALLAAGGGRQSTLMNPLRGAFVVAAAAIGVAAGVSGYTFLYARGWSYLTNDPRACANCHVMQEQYDGWVKSSHRSVAVCNDCHTPPGLLGKYWTKAENGFRHSWAFTTGDFHEPIHIVPSDRAVTERACRHCHAEVVQAMLAQESRSHARGFTSCIRCHGSVGHKELSATDVWGSR
jgi:cytochrome c nitrite reductase small subunit